MTNTSNHSGTSVSVNQVDQNEAFSEKKKLSSTDGLSSIARSAVAVFEEYAVKMKPDLPQLEAQAIRYQVGLYRAITNTINKNSQDFNKAWGLLLKIFNDNKDGAFSERALYRYMSNITLSQDQCVAFRRITVLMRQTAPVDGRGRVVKMIDLNRVLEKDITPEGRQRVINFYAQFNR